MSGPGPRKLTFREKMDQFRAGRAVMEGLIQQELARLKTQPPSERERERKKAMLQTIVLFIIGLSVILSYEWRAEPPGWRPDAPNVILFGILVAAIIYIAARYTDTASVGMRLSETSRVLLPAYLVLAGSSAFLVLLAVNNPLGSDWSRNLFVDLAVGFMMSLIVVFLVDRVLSVSQERERVRRTEVAFRQLQRPLLEHLGLLAEMFKASTNKRPKPKEKYATVADFFDDDFYEAIRYMDFAKPAPRFPAVDWFTHAASTCSRFREDMNQLLAKYAADFEPRTLELIETVVNTAFFNLLLQVRAIKVAAAEFKRQYPPLFRDPSLVSIVKDHVRVFLELVSVYDASSMDRRIVLPSELWAEDVTPRYGDARKE